MMRQSNGNARNKSDNDVVKSVPSPQPNSDPATSKLDVSSMSTRENAAQCLHEGTTAPETQPTHKTSNHNNNVGKEDKTSNPTSELDKPLQNDNSDIIESHPTTSAVGEKASIIIEPFSTQASTQDKSFYESSINQVKVVNPEPAHLPLASSSYNEVEFSSAQVVQGAKKEEEEDRETKEPKNIQGQVIIQSMEPAILEPSSLSPEKKEDIYKKDKQEKEVEDLADVAKKKTRLEGQVLVRMEPPVLSLSSPNAERTLKTSAKDDEEKETEDEDLAKNAARLEDDVIVQPTKPPVLPLSSPSPERNVILSKRVEQRKEEDDSSKKAAKLEGQVIVRPMEPPVLSLSSPSFEKKVILSKKVKQKEDEDDMAKKAARLEGQVIVQPMEPPVLSLSSPSFEKNVVFSKKVEQKEDEDDMAKKAARLDAQVILQRMEPPLLSVTSPDHQKPLVSFAKVNQDLEDEDAVKQAARLEGRTNVQRTEPPVLALTSPTPEKSLIFSKKVDPELGDHEAKNAGKFQEEVSRQRMEPPVLSLTSPILKKTVVSSAQVEKLREEEDEEEDTLKKAARLEGQLIVQRMEPPLLTSLSPQGTLKPSISYTQITKNSSTIAKNIALEGQVVIQRLESPTLSVTSPSHQKVFVSSAYAQGEERENEEEDPAKKAARLHGPVVLQRREPPVFSRLSTASEGDARKAISSSQENDDDDEEEAVKKTARLEGQVFIKPLEPPEFSVTSNAKREPEALVGNAGNASKFKEPSFLTREETPVLSSSPYAELDHNTAVSSEEHEEDEEEDSAKKAARLRGPVILQRREPPRLPPASHAVGGKEAGLKQEQEQELDPESGIASLAAHRSKRSKPLSQDEATKLEARMQGPVIVQRQEPALLSQVTNEEKRYARPLLSSTGEETGMTHADHSPDDFVAANAPPEALSQTTKSEFQDEAKKSKDDLLKSVHSSEEKREHEKESSRAKGAVVIQPTEPAGLLSRAAGRNSYGDTSEQVLSEDELAKLQARPQVQAQSQEDLLRAPGDSSHGLDETRNEHRIINGAHSEWSKEYIAVNQLNVDRRSLDPIESSDSEGSLAATSPRPIIVSNPSSPNAETTDEAVVECVPVADVTPTESEESAAFPERALESQMSTGTVVATPISPEDDEESEVIVEALVLPEKTLRDVLGDRRVKILLAFLSMAAVAIVVLAVFLSPRSSDTVPPTATPPTPQPSKFDQIYNVVLPVSGMEVLQDVTSPQYRALDWMAEVDRARLDFKDEDRIIQRYVVAVFYYSTGGENWTDQREFLTDEHECLWETGTPVCDLARLRSLVMGGNNLNGTIPVELVHLPKLQVLNLSQNALFGAIPPELIQLTDLERIDLTNNTLTGSIPSNISKLEKLQALILESNELEGSIPASISNITSLTHVFLHDNNITGTIPADIGRLTELEVLALRNNRLYGSLPPSIGNLITLKLMFLEDNELSGSIPEEIGGMTNTEKLAFSGNNLKGTMPTTFGLLTNMTVLNLPRNNLDGTIPTEFGFLTKMDRLDVRRNSLVGTIPSELGLLRNVTMLNLARNQLSGTLPVELGRLTNMRNLTLDTNNINGTLPLSFSNLTSIGRIRIFSNDITGDASFLCSSFGDNVEVFLDCKELGCTCEFCKCVG